jgi:site-specific DNA-methyltransferase (adenine-specific)
VPKKSTRQKKTLTRPADTLSRPTGEGRGEGAHSVKPLYRRKPPKPGRESRDESREPKAVSPKSKAQSPKAVSPISNFELPTAKFLAPAHFELREDGTIDTLTRPGGHPLPSDGRGASPRQRADDNSPSPGGEGRDEGGPSLPKLVYQSDSPFIRLYHGNCLELLDAIAARYPEGRFDAIFADPPYFLSNGGITCHAGKMVKVDKGGWDVSRGPELNHEFNREWLLRCQKVLKPNGTLWVTGTHHVIFSIGYALQQLGFKILNDIAWEKPNPPPNLSCRYFTHSTETVLWAAKNEKSKHVFNYAAMKVVSGKQMKTVWRGVGARHEALGSGKESVAPRPAPTASSLSDAPEMDEALNSIWTIGTPSADEKKMGKHPTQKPVALVERCLLASTNEGDLVLDPFLGNGTTAVASLRLKRGCVGIELDLHNVEIAAKRVKSALEENTDLFTPPPENKWKRLRTIRACQLSSRRQIALGCVRKFSSIGLMKSPARRRLQTPIATTWKNYLMARKFI